MAVLSLRPGRALPLALALAVVVAAVTVAAGYQRWTNATIHNATPVFTRTTSDGVTIVVERGDVRWRRNSCPPDGHECAGRSPGIAVSFELPDGRTGGGSTFPDPAPAPTGLCTSGDSGTLQVVTTAGLGIPPGSAQQTFVLARTSTAVARVRATRANGSTDEMAPVDGLVVLATTAGWKGDIVEAFDGEGRPLDRCDARARSASDGQRAEG